LSGNEMRNVEVMMLAQLCLSLVACGSDANVLPWTDLAAGSLGTCLAHGGRLVCWGSNSAGIFGYGHDSPVGDDESPDQAGSVILPNKVTEIAMDGSHMCALVDPGNVVCWGNNTEGQLGLEPEGVAQPQSPLDSLSPVDIGDVAVHITAAGSHTCALTVNGNVVCWGRNDLGQLGLGHTDEVGLTAKPATAGLVSLPEVALAIDTAPHHTCIIVQSNRVLCWGGNTLGQLGTQSADWVGDNELPSSEQILELGGQVVGVAVEGQQSCAIRANTMENEIVCWGANGWGQAGYGHTEDIGDDEPPDTWGAIDIGGSVERIAVSGSHACAIRSDQAVICWGKNDVGQLGYGHTETSGDDEAPAAMGVVDVGGAADGLALGPDHTCVLRTDRAIVCWGANDVGQLGYGHVKTIGDNETPESAGTVSVGKANTP
jgi:alpha-tubulin suppressor-like RCC1 family protein